MRRFSLTLAVFSALVPASLALNAYAQDKAVDVAVRAAVQDGFIRLVFTGDTLPQADVTESGAGSLRVSFAKAVKLSGGAGGVKPDTAITADDAKTLTIKTGDLERHRTLVLGNRLFVDLFTKQKPQINAGDNAAAAKTPAKAAETKPDEKKADVKPVAENAAKSASLVTDSDAAVKTAPVSKVAAPKMPALAVEPVEVTGTPILAPVKSEATPAIVTPGAAFAGTATITIGSTQGVALAAFQRAGYLWIVLSQEALSVPPQVSGTGAAQLGPVDTVKVDGGSAYRLKMPEGAYVHPEGAGLVWRLIIDGNKTPLKSVTPSSDFGDAAAGPQMHIPLTGAVNVLKVPDPMIGDDLAVVTVARSDTRLVSDDKFVDFDMVPAIVGAVIRPKADGMRISVSPQDVLIARQGGLRMSAAGPRTPRVATVSSDKAEEASSTAPTRMFQLNDWALGGPKQYLEMRRSIDRRVAEADEDRKLPELISGAKFMLGQGMPQEAMGFLQMALNFLPVLRESAEFQALRGAVYALAGQPDDALAAFEAPGLQGNDEINLWKAYALAQKDNFTEAQKLMPKTTTLVASYPARVQALMLPSLIETVLARGDVGLADSLVDLYARAADPASFTDKEIAIAYFKGRTAQLRGDMDAATESFREASDGIQGPYPVRATLALVQRGLSGKTISREDAVRKLERFRFGWRGDRLESDMLQRLGLVYVTGGEQRRGLSILRDAATMAEDPADRAQLVAVMQKAFRELFSGKTREKMTPMESATVAAEFAELMPSGGEGEQITLNIADQMVAVDLLDRAAEMIEPMIERTEKLSDAIRYAQRAAAIRLTDRRPEDALKDIDKALSRPDALAEKTMPAADLKAVALLRAKAKAELKKPDEALAELATIPEDGDSLRLKADIAWGAQKWPVAADAFGKLIMQANLDATRPPTREQAQLVLNRALALNLAGNGAELETLRLTHGDIMRRSELNQPFQLVTRTARQAKLADRTTLLKLVSEVDLFKDVLEAYKAAPPASPTPATGQTDQKPEAASPAAKPAETPQ